MPILASTGVAATLTPCKNGLGDEEADGANAHPQNFWARTAPEGLIAH